MRYRVDLLAGTLLAALSGCATRDSANEPKSAGAVLPASLPNVSIPLDVREFDVVSADGGARGVFLKLSRLPEAVTHRSESDPARIVLTITGPAGTDSPAESFSSGDALVTSMQVSRQAGELQVVLDIAAEAPPEYEVLPMADWVLVRIRPASTKRPWAHRAS
jgi:hypothetical protein